MRKDQHWHELRAYHRTTHRQTKRKQVLAARGGSAHRKFGFSDSIPQSFFTKQGGRPEFLIEKYDQRSQSFTRSLSEILRGWLDRIRGLKW